MDGAAIRTDDAEMRVERWYFDDIIDFEDKKKTLRQEKQKLEQERWDFDRERREFAIQKKLETRQREKEKQLFEMKWKILEEEIKKLANERAQVERQRNFYKYVTEYETNETTEQNRVKADMFFIGVTSAQELKKRYKDLLKIYHPDNVCGDTETVLEIKREYDKLKTVYTN